MIEAPVRAYLMIRSSDDTWSVTVCRDLGSVMRTWRLRQQPDRDVAVLHVGFDRPPSHSFDEIAGAYHGRMLLTAAAKHALPSSFVSSAEPVFNTEYADVYIGLKGWGYTLEDPTSQSLSIERSSTMNFAVPDSHADVITYPIVSPEVIDRSESHGRSKNVPHHGGKAVSTVQHCSGGMSAQDFAGVGYVDPCEMARAAPQWLAERNLASLDLQVRSEKVFRKNNIKKVKDLAGWTQKELLNLRNFGETSLRDTVRALKAAFNEGASQDGSDVRSSYSVHQVKGLVSLPGYPDDSSTTIPMQPKPQGWVFSFLIESPTAASTFAMHGIHDDVSYLESEARLDRSVRHRSGVFRTHHLVGVSCDDPCELARAAPPWLADRELSSFNLKVRADSVFKKNEITTVTELADWTPAKLLKLRNFGRTSLKEILQAIKTALDEGPPLTEMDENPFESGRLLTELRRSLLLFSDRQRDIIRRRLGIGTSPQTLEQIAANYGVTRERIRQIESNATKKLILESYWDNKLEQKITRLLIGRSYPLPVAGVEAIDPWFEGVSSQVELFKNLVRIVCKEHIHFLDIDGICYFSLISKDIWKRLISEAEELLVSGVGQEWTEDYARSLVQSLLPDTATEFRSMLWEKASRLCHFSANTDGLKVLKQYGHGASQLVETVLAESETPLHYTVITELASKKTGRSYDVNTIHQAAARVGLLLAPGTYGLYRHVSLSEEQMSLICTEAEEVVISEASGRQWHTTEILTELTERSDGGFEIVDKYLLDVILAKSDILKPLGKMTWTEIRPDTNDQTRINIHEAVVSLLEAAGHPLSTKEIKERLTAVRGINESLQVFPIDPLIQLQPGFWGINDRDVPLSRKEQQELIEDLVNKLESKQAGIHASELNNVLSLQGCPPDAILSIATLDSRLKKTRRYVYLAKWEDPRRETICQAVSTVFENSAKPLSLKKIVSRVNRRVGRELSKPVIYSALRSLEAEFDETTRKWSTKKANW